MNLIPEVVTYKSVFNQRFTCIWDLLILVGSGGWFKRQLWFVYIVVGSKVIPKTLKNSVKKNQP